MTCHKNVMTKGNKYHEQRELVNSTYMYGCGIMSNAHYLQKYH